MHSEIKYLPGKLFPNGPEIPVLVTSIQVHNLSHHTVQYGTHSFADSGESGSASRVAHSFGSGKLYICLSNKCFKVYPAYSLCDRRKTLTGSPDPKYMQPADKPCISLFSRADPFRNLTHIRWRHFVEMTLYKTETVLYFSNLFSRSSRCDSFTKSKT